MGSFTLRKLIILALRQQLGIGILLMLSGYFCLYQFIGGVVNNKKIIDYEVARFERLRPRQDGRDISRASYFKVLLKKVNKVIAHWGKQLSVLVTNQATEERDGMRVELEVLENSIVIKRASVLNVSPEKYAIKLDSEPIRFPCVRLKRVNLETGEQYAREFCVSEMQHAGGAPEYKLYESRDFAVQRSVEYNADAGLDQNLSNYYEGICNVVNDLKLEFYVPAVLFGALFWCVYMQRRSKTSDFKKLMPKLVVFVALVFITQFMVCMNQYLFRDKAVFLFSGLLLRDAFSVQIKLLCTIFGIYNLLLLYKYVREESVDLPLEFPILYGLVIFVACQLVMAANMLSFYVLIELLGITLIILMGIKGTSGKLMEGSIKYFVMNGVASALLLMGFGGLFFITRKTNFIDIYSLPALPAAESFELSMILTIALVMLAGSFLIKVGAAPFHFWVPDVYEGTRYPLTTLLATLSKFSLFCAYSRLFHWALYNYIGIWSKFFFASFLLSVIVGAVGGLMQKNIKRLLAYSSISHIGFLLMGISFDSQLSLTFGFLYLIIYIISAQIAFGALAFTKTGLNTPRAAWLSELSNLSTRQPIVALQLSVSILSMIGIPPLAGFYTKFFVLAGPIRFEHYFVAAVTVVVTLISAFYYLRVLKIIYFGEKTARSSFYALGFETYKHLLFLALGFTLLILLFFLFSNHIYKMIDSIAFSLNHPLSYFLRRYGH